MVDKERALDIARAQLEKSFGRGALMRLGETAQATVEVIPTGSIALDLALGVGGIPRGRITEIYGTEGSGKTTLALHLVAEAMKLGGTALFVDAEHALDVEYSKSIGVDAEKLYVSQPATGEEALEIMDVMIRSGAVDIVVLDSVAALVPKAEFEGEMGDAFVGIQARLMSQALRKIGGSTSKSRTAVIFINQMREKIGVMFGNPETTPGGRALRFWASVRLEVRRGDTIKNGTEAVGVRTKVKAVKNKVAPPFRNAEFDIIFGKGISRIGDLIDVGASLGIIGKSGTWFNYGETRLGQGRENARAYLEENPIFVEEIDQKIREASKAAKEVAPDTEKKATVVEEVSEDSK
ncbi:MAG: recombinase RecA [bacterium]